MGILTGKRAQRIVNEQAAIERSINHTVKNAQASLARAIQFYAWAMQSYLDGNEIAATDLEIMQAEYSALAPEILKLVEMTQDLAGIQAGDATTTQDNLNSLVQKYGVNISSIDQGFNL